MILDAKRKQDKKAPELLATCLMFILSYAWLIFWHYYSNPLLIMFPYSSFIIPSSFILLGGLIANPVSQITKRQFKNICIVTIGSLILPTIMLNIFPIIEKLQGNNFLIILFSLTLLATLVVSIKYSKIAIITAVTFGILFYLTSENSFVYLADRFKGQDNFKAVISASQDIDAYYPNHNYKDFRLWFRSDENYNTFFSLAAVYLYPWGSAMDNLISSKKPHDKLTLAPSDDIQLGDRIVIVSSDVNSGEILDEANQTLSSHYLKLLLEKSEAIQENRIRFYLYFTQAISFNSQ